MGALRIGGTYKAINVVEDEVPEEYEGQHCRPVAVYDEGCESEYYRCEFEGGREWYLSTENLVYVGEPQAPLDTQVGGDHYTKMVIQPLEYILANNLPFPEGSVVKYVSRWRSKGGVQDLKKARDFLDKLIAHEEKTTSIGEKA